VDKFKKELKKSDVPGLAQFWDSMFTHIRNIAAKDESEVSVK
jgi:hypothetical protein